MGTPGLGYALYLFDGKRGNRVPKNGYGICLYDSRNVPEPPIIKDPVLQIDQNSAGTVTFTLLSDAEGTIMSEGVAQPPSTKIMDYVCYMQSEIVVYRSKAVRNSNVPIYEEIWAGRVYSIKKDFYNDWKITAEGSLAYFNDFSMLEKKWEGAAGKGGDTIFRELINLYNTTINTADSDLERPGTNRTIRHGVLEFMPLNRHIFVGTVSLHAWKAATKISNSDTSFTISEGTTFMSALNSLLSRFGGFFEITYTYASDTGYSSTIINWYKDNEYKSVQKGQTIVFGTNLLDYIEDLEDSEFFTALYPMGSTNETTEDESGTKKTTKKTIDIHTLSAKTDGNITHPDKSYYIYDKELVKQYGFIEKKEKWEIGDASELMKIAFDYYKELHLGEPVVEINAFDLKNLITTDLKKDSYYNIDSLYLYDRIKISGYPFHSEDVKSIPITGIEIPLDKFPTDTKYTMSNKNLSKNALAPGNIPGTKPEENLPDPEPGENEDPDPTKEDPVKYLHPVGSDLGIDANMPHYPMVYLRRSASQWQCSVFRLSGEAASPGVGVMAWVTFWNPDKGWIDKLVDSSTGTNTINPALKSGIIATVTATEHNHKVTKEQYWNWINETRVPITPDYSINGYAAEINENHKGKDRIDRGDFYFSNSSTIDYPSDRIPEFKFFSDNMSSTSSPLLRIRDPRPEAQEKDEEKKNDYYEIANNDKEPPTLVANPLNVYTSGYAPIFNHSEANVLPNQNWRNHFTLSKQQITQKITGAEQEFNYYWINVPELTEISKSNYRNKISSYAFQQLPVLGDSNINTILGTIGAELIADEYSNHFDIRLDYSINSSGTDKVSIYRHLIDYWPEPNADTSRHMGLLASWTNAAKDTTVIYYSYINGQAISPLPIGSVDKKIDTVFSENSTASDKTAQLERCVSFYEAIADGLAGSYYDLVDNPNANAQLVTMKRIMTAIFNDNKPFVTVGSIGAFSVIKNGETFSIDTGAFNDYNFPSGVYGLNQAKAILLHGGSGSNPKDTDIKQDIDKMYGDAVKLKLVQTMKPLLIITKVKEIGSGGDQYGVIFSGGRYYTGDEPGDTHENSIHVEDGKNILYDDILLSGDANGNNNPILYCKDVLTRGNGGIFKYYEDDGGIAVDHPVITYIKESHAPSPITVLTRCGGPHTNCISTGVYSQLCGSGKGGTPFNVWKTTWPAYIDGEPTRVPNYRSKKYSDSANIWYDGVDMRHAPNKTSLPLSLSFDDSESQKYMEDLQYRVPVAIGEDLFIRVGPAFIKNTPVESEGD